MPSAGLSQILIQIGQRFTQKAHSSLGDPGDNGIVEDEQGYDRTTGGGRRGEDGVVVNPQVAGEQRDRRRHRTAVPGVPVPQPPVTRWWTDGCAQRKTGS